MINQYTLHDMLDTRRAIDNYRRDQFIQYSYGFTCESCMDHLIASIVEFQDKHDVDNIDDSQDLNSVEYDTIDTKDTVVVSNVATRGSGIVNTPICPDINYPGKSKGCITV